MKWSLLLVVVAGLAGCGPKKAQPLTMTEAEIFASCPAFAGKNFGRMQGGALESFELLYPNSSIASYVTDGGDQCSCIKGARDPAPKCTYTSKADLDRRAEERAQRRAAQGLPPRPGGTSIVIRQ